MYDTDEVLEDSKKEPDELVETEELSPEPCQTTEQTTEQSTEQATPIPHDGKSQVVRVRMAEPSASPWTTMAAAVVCLAVLALIAYVLWRGAQREDELLGAVFELGKGA